MRQFILIICMIISFSFCFVRIAHAQSWWDSAKKAMESDTGQQVLKHLQNPRNQSQSIPDVAAQLTGAEIDSGLRQALSIGTQRVVKQIGVIDGFNLDPKIHIPLPRTLQKVKKILSSVGMGSLADDLELRLNRAAETATPQAKEGIVIITEYWMTRGTTTTTTKISR